MRDKKNLQVFMSVVVATVLVLTTHIYMAEWMKPFLDAIMKNATAQGILSPDPSHYPPIIMYAAYGTAFMITGSLVFFYYHLQHLVPGKSNFTKILLVTAIIFMLKGGDLIRQPIMDIILNYTIGFSNPILFVVLNHVDKWLANLLLAICLVFLCPRKYREAI